MIYGYKIIDGVIQPVGASDTLERLTKALTMAGISTEDMQTQETELVSVNGVYYLSETDEDYIKAKAEADEMAREASLQPTDSDRIDAIEAMLLELAGGDE